ncbi:hypothetical protein PENTCL1PPCAC_799, partial [Pristionchus entomophagus]
GYDLRSALVGNLRGIAENIVRMHADEAPEVKRLIRKLYTLAHAAEWHAAQGIPAYGLRAPLDDLCVAVDRHAFRFITNVDMFQLMHYLRLFIAITIGLVAGDLPPAIAVPHVMVAPPGRPFQQQRALPVAPMPLAVQQARPQPIVRSPRQALQQLQPLPNVLPQQAQTIKKQLQQILVQVKDEEKQLVRPREEEQQLQQALVQPKEEDQQLQQPDMPVSPSTSEQK